MSLELRTIEQRAAFAIGIILLFVFVSTLVYGGFTGDYSHSWALGTIICSFVIMIYVGVWIARGEV